MLKILFSGASFDTWRQAISHVLALACSLLIRLSRKLTVNLRRAGKYLVRRCMLGFVIEIDHQGKGYPKMSSEEDSKEVEKKSRSKLMLILLIFVVILGAGGAGAYFMFLKKGPVGAGAAKEINKPVYYPMNTFLVNLADPGAKRFLKVTMELELSSKETEDECKLIEFQIRDLFLTLLSSQESDGIISPDDKLQLKKRLMNSLNHILTKGKVMDIYFTDFLIQ